VAAERDLIRGRSAAGPYAVFGLLGLVAVLRYTGSLDRTSPRTALFVTASTAAMVGGATAALMATWAIRSAPAPVPVRP
jgi:hypothetical protein